MIRAEFLARDFRGVADGDSHVNGRALLLSRDARLLLVEAEAWCDNQETDGFIPTSAIRMVTDSPDPDAAAAELVERGYWLVTDGGWDVIGFVERHESSETRTESRAETARRMRGSRLHGKNIHNADGPRYCPECSAERSAERSAVRSGVDGKREARSAKREPTHARSAPPSAYAPGSASLAGPKRKMSDEARAKVSAAAKAAHERRRAEKAERDERTRIQAEERARVEAEAREQEAEGQRVRDAEWVRAGGDPAAVPVSVDQLLQLVNPKLYQQRMHERRMQPRRRTLR